MKPNALDGAVAAVLCCCTTRLVRRPRWSAAGSTSVDVVPTVMVIEPCRLGQSLLEQLSGALDTGSSGMPVPRFQREG
jgi:hypothetical protein